MKHFAVMGDPIAHSWSPFIHASFAAACGIELEYTRIRVPRGELAAAVQGFRDGGGSGLNVSLPHKEAAFEMADVPSERARRAGAANTLWFSRHGIEADNTDGVGLLNDLQRNLGLPLAGRRLLLLGAGGAARGVMAPLLGARPALLHIANRTAPRARQLADDFAALGPVAASSLADLPLQAPFDLVVNATSASVAGVTLDLPAALLGPSSAAYDMMYGARPTPFMDWATQHGVQRVHDGLGMLVEQAAAAFQIWLHTLPQTAPVMAAMRSRIAAGQSPDESP